MEGRRRKTTFPDRRKKKKNTIPDGRIKTVLRLRSKRERNRKTRRRDCKERTRKSERNRKNKEIYKRREISRQLRCIERKERLSVISQKMKLVSICCVICHPTTWKRERERNRAN